MPPAHKIDKARIVAERIEDRVDSDVQREPIALIDHFGKPGKSLIEVSPSHVGKDIIRGGHVIALQALAVEVLQLSLCQSERAALLDPFFPGLSLHRGTIFFFLRDYDSAIKRFAETLETYPDYAAAHEHFGDAYEKKGMLHEAITQWSAALTLSGKPEHARMLEEVFATSGFQADNVRCTHGATSGQMDEDELFYLRTHGIPTKVAQRLLVTGFLDEVIQRLNHPAIAMHLQRLIEEKFAR